MTADDYSDAVRPLVSGLHDAGCEDMGNAPGTPLTMAQRDSLIALALSPGHYGLQYSSQDAHPAADRAPREIFAAVKTDELHGVFYVIGIDGSVRDDT